MERESDRIWVQSQAAVIVVHTDRHLHKLSSLSRVTVPPGSLREHANTLCFLQLNLRLEICVCQHTDGALHASQNADKKNPFRLCFPGPTWSTQWNRALRKSPSHCLDGLRGVNLSNGD